MAKPMLTIERIATRPAKLTGQTLVDVWISPEECVWWLTLQGPLDMRSENGMFPKLHAEEPNQYAVCRQTPTGIVDLNVETKTTRNLHFVRAAGEDDHLLLIAGRTKGTSDCNARLFTRDGALVREFDVGDAIQHVDVTANGELFVSYFDEGMGTPLGDQGLNQFDLDGNQVWGYNRQVSEDLEIFDCYAMNIEDANSVYVCPYTEFHVVRSGIHREVEDMGKAPIAGARALAISDRYVLFFGGYDNRRGLTLASRDRLRKKRHKLTGSVPETLETVFGRGPNLYLASDEAVFRLRVPD